MHISIFVLTELPTCTECLISQYNEQWPVWRVDEVGPELQLGGDQFIDVRKIVVENLQYGEHYMQTEIGEYFALKVVLNNRFRDSQLKN